MKKLPLIASIAACCLATSVMASSPSCISASQLESDNIGLVFADSDAAVDYQDKCGLGDEYTMVEAFVGDGSFELLMPDVTTELRGRLGAF